MSLARALYLLPRDFNGMCCQLFPGRNCIVESGTMFRDRATWATQSIRFFFSEDLVMNVPIPDDLTLAKKKT